MKDLTKTIISAGNIADDSFESAEERQQALSMRHKADMGSDNWLSKSIRPITLIVLLALEALLILLDAFGREISIELQLQIGALLMSAFGFYFNSKKAERIAEKNAKANIEIEKQKIQDKHENNRLERKLKRKSSRRFFNHDEDDFEKNTNNKEDEL